MTDYIAGGGVVSEPASEAQFSLGDRVRILGTVEKVRTPEGESTFVTAYKEVPGAPWDYSDPRAEDGRRTYEHGIVVGKRHPQTGTMSYYPPSAYEDSPGFRSTGSVTVYLVAYSPHRKHVMCLPSQITRGER